MYVYTHNFNRGIYMHVYDSLCKQEFFSWALGLMQPIKVYVNNYLSMLLISYRITITGWSSGTG